MDNITDRLYREQQQQQYDAELAQAARTGEQRLRIEAQINEALLAQARQRQAAIAFGGLLGAVSGGATTNNNSLVNNFNVNGGDVQQIIER